MNRRYYSIQTPPYPEQYRFQTGIFFDFDFYKYRWKAVYISVTGRTYGKLYKADFKMFTGDDVIEVKSCFETFYLCQLNFSCN